MINPLLLEVLNIQSVTYDTERMAEFIIDKCFELGCSVEYDKGNIYVTKGVSDTYPCIVSHTDTVHAIIPDSDYMVVSDDNIAMAYDIRKMQPTGVGGDDKVGIYICLQMLKDLDYCKAAFFRDEEHGCLGSAEADMDFFKDCRYVLQCDRKGNNDFVYNIMGTDLYTPEFYDAIEPILTGYGYSEIAGGLTDVYTLADNGVGICVANMSCGYYNPHMDDEMINLDDVENCRWMVYTMFTTIIDTFQHKIEKKKKYNHYGNGFKGYTTYNGAAWDQDVVYSKSDIIKAEEQDWYGYSKSYKKNNKEYCTDCYMEFDEDVSNKYSVCPDCLAYYEDDLGWPAVKNSIPNVIGIRDNYNIPF